MKINAGKVLKKISIAVFIIDIIYIVITIITTKHESFSLEYNIETIGGPASVLFKAVIAYGIGSLIDAVYCILEKVEKIESKYNYFTFLQSSNPASSSSQQDSSASTETCPPST